LFWLGAILALMWLLALMTHHTRSERPKPKETREERSLPLLPIRDTVQFPHAVLPLTVGRESSVQLINSLGKDKTIIVVAQREARVDSPQPSDLYTVGTLAVVHKVIKMPNQSLFVFAEGLERVKLTEFTQLTPFMRAQVATIAESIPTKSAEIEALQRNVLTLFQQIVAGSPTLSDELSSSDQHRGAGTAGGLHRVFVAVAVDRGQAGHARNHGRECAPGEDQPALGQGAGTTTTTQQEPVARVPPPSCLRCARRRSRSASPVAHSRVR